MTIKPYISLFASLLLSSCMTQSPAPIDFKSTQPSFSQSYSEKTVVNTDEIPSRILTRELKHQEENKNDRVIPLTIRDRSEEKSHDEVVIHHEHVEHKQSDKPISTKSIEEELEELENPKQKENKKLPQKKVEPLKTEHTEDINDETKSEMIIKPEPLNQEHTQETNEPNTNNISLSIPVNGKIATKFGEMVNGKKVNGIDFIAARGADVTASASGTVVFAGNDPKFGNLVIIKSNNSDAFVAYAHMEDLLVSSNEDITNGQLIGHVGSSGEATTAKLHFALRIGKKPVDPIPYLKQ